MIKHYNKTFHLQKINIIANSDKQLHHILNSVILSILSNILILF